MSTLRSIPVLAVDGGGTRCRVAVSDTGGVTVAETGPANVSTDFDGGVREILRGLNRLAERVGINAEALADHPVFVGVAGVVEPAIGDRLRAALPFARVRIADDRPAALRGALGEMDGFLAHCGTGSFFGAQTGRTMRFVGGWGPVLGDEASAQWVGRAALALSLESTDGRRAMTPLTERLLADFGGPAGIVRFAGTARPQEFGAVAPLVTQSAATGDAMARRIMVAGAAEIARTSAHLGWRAGSPICLTGGIGPQFATYLPEEMRACIAAPQGDPLQGAIALAHDFAQETADERR